MKYIVLMNMNTLL